MFLEEAVPATLTGQCKYKKDEELLKKYEDECRYGTAKPHGGLLSRTELDDATADNDDEATIQNIDYFKFRSNFISTASSLQEGARPTATLLAQRMKNDFSKNDEEEEEEDEEPSKRYTHSEMCNCFFFFK